MKQLQGIMETVPGRYKGARVIRIEAVPAHLPESLFGEVLSRLGQKSLSAELYLSTGKELDGTVLTLLILRAEGVYPYQVLQRLETGAGMVLQRLEKAGIVASQVEKGLTEFLNTEVPVKGKSLRGFYVKNTLPASVKAYVPGSYGTVKDGPVSLPALFSVLGSYPDSSLRLQIRKVFFLPEERKVLENSLRWYEKQPDSILRQSAKNQYGRLAGLKDKDLYMVSVYGSGSDVFLNDLCAGAAKYGLENFAAGMDILQRPGYLMRGDEWLAAETAAKGHRPDLCKDLSGPMKRLAHLASLEEIQKAFSLSGNMQELGGLPINRTVSASEPLPKEMKQEGGLFLGTVSQGGQPVYLPPKALTRHGFFVGKPGSGKTVFALGMLYRLSIQKPAIPFTVIEMAKTEYRSLAEKIPKLRVLSMGRQDLMPLSLNPFLPPAGITLEQYEPQLESIFRMAISMAHPLDVIFPQVISRCYAAYGWRPDSTRDSEGVKHFGMLEFIREFKSYVKENYGSDPEAESNINNGGTVRLMAMMKNPLFDTNRSIDIEKLMEEPTVIELDALSSREQKAMVAGILLSQMMMVIRKRGAYSEGLRNLILIDEAHLLLSPGNTGRQEGSAAPEEAALELLQDMTMILRAYGTGLLFGDQSPSRLTASILENVNLKMMFRLDSSGDRRILQDTSRISDQMAEAMVNLPAGQGFLYCDEMSSPEQITVPNAEKLLGLNKAMADEEVKKRSSGSVPPPFTQCDSCGACRNCDSLLRSDAKFIASQILSGPDVSQMLQVPEQGRLAGFLQSDLENACMKTAEKFRMKAEDPGLLTGCVKVQLIRALLLADRCTLTEEEMTQGGHAPDPEDVLKSVMLT